MPSEVNDMLTMFGGGSAVVALFVWGVRKMMTTWAREATEQTKTEADDQLITRLSKHINSLDTRVTELDALVHRQAIHLTKLQMLILRMEGCMEANGVSMPADLRDDLEKLTK